MEEEAFREAEVRPPKCKVHLSKSVSMAVTLEMSGEKHLHTGKMWMINLSC